MTGQQFGANGAVQKRMPRDLFPAVLLLVFSAVAIAAWMRVDIASTPPPAESQAYPAAVDPMLAFNGVTVADAVRIFNSRNEVQLVVSDHSIAEKKIGGAFHTHQPEQFAAALRRPLGIVVVHQGNTIRLERAAPPTGAAPASP